MPFPDSLIPSAASSRCEFAFKQTKPFSHNRVHLWKWIGLGFSSSSDCRDEGRKGRLMNGVGAGVLEYIKGGSRATVWELKDRSCPQLPCLWLAWPAVGQLERGLGQEKSLPSSACSWQHQAWQLLTGKVNNPGGCKIWERHQSESSLFFFHCNLHFENQSREASKPSEIKTHITFQVLVVVRGVEGGRELIFWIGQLLDCPGVFGNHLLSKERNK